MDNTFGGSAVRKISFHKVSQILIIFKALNKFNDINQRLSGKNKQLPLLELDCPTNDIHEMLVNEDFVINLETDDVFNRTGKMRHKKNRENEVNDQISYREIITSAKRLNAQVLLMIIRNINENILKEISGLTQRCQAYNKLSTKYDSGNVDTELRTLSQISKNNRQYVGDVYQDEWIQYIDLNCQVNQFHELFKRKETDKEENNDLMDIDLVSIKGKGRGQTPIMLHLSNVWPLY
ncbi:hypothetical protein H8356DRAFT_1329802 [Neocallimastix lanati (nom. inval.)]|nr:hypothetical protein H8356DRAFT_1329802 [Neocallimastix sp. JGI-2020a]